MLVIENGKRLTEDDVRKYLKGSHTNGEERNLPVYVPKSAEFGERELIYRALVDLKTDIVDMKNLLINAARLIYADEARCRIDNRRGGSRQCHCSSPCTRRGKHFAWKKWSGG